MGGRMGIKPKARKVRKKKVRTAAFFSILTPNRAFPVSPQRARNAVQSQPPSPKTKGGDPKYPVKPLAYNGRVPYAQPLWIEFTQSDRMCALALRLA